MAEAPPRRTKIVATIGPACSTPETLAALVHAGVDGARLNLSHGTHDQHREWARLVREIEGELGRPIALIADLQGPKLRIGDLAEPISLHRGDEIVVGPAEGSTNGELPVSPAVISEVLQPGHDVLIDDGLVRLRVDSVESGRARCAVVEGGVVTSHKGVNLPGVPVPIPSITRKDMDDLELALELGVDFVALSFVRSAADVRDLRDLIEQAGSHAHVIAKIEKAEAVDALDEIREETDAVMVARGDLGVEIGVALVPLLQKRIIIAALERGKPVITATQMLESMIHQAEPTRAEASDVANAILDGTSALMLSGETAVGEFRSSRSPTWTGLPEPSSPAWATATNCPSVPTSRRSARRCRTRPATSPRRCGRRRSSCPPTRAARPRWSRGCGLGGRSSHSHTTTTRCGRWPSNGA